MYIDDAIHSHSTIAISETIDTKKLLCYSWFAEKERIGTPFEGSNSYPTSLISIKTSNRGISVSMKMIKYN